VKYGRVKVQGGGALELKLRAIHVAVILTTKPIKFSYISCEAEAFPGKSIESAARKLWMTEDLG
jgi:hypothetical protein